MLSPTLAINERVADLRAAGEDVLHLGFGEAGLPVHPLLADALRAGVSRNSYEPVAGRAVLRAEIAGWFGRRGLITSPEAVVVTPGSKAALFGLLHALPGDLVLPRPSWVSYAPQAALLGKRVIHVDIPDAAGGIPDPARLREALDTARRAGRIADVLLLTVPDNPTGTYPDEGLLAAVMEIARDEGLAVIVDEIYRELAHEPGSVPSAASFLPERTFVTTGLSKALALGGWRLGVARLPDSDLGTEIGARLVAFGSEIWSCASAPVAGAAELAYSDPPELLDFVARARALHRMLSRAVHDVLVEAGADCRAPTAGFYLYPTLGGRGSDVELAETLLERHRIAVLPGSAFGDDPPARRVRIATSLLCGTGDGERWEALNAAATGELLELPRIRSALERLSIALRQLPI
jgi:aspartate aminotransferase